jgi:hypothetical protein
MFCLIIPNCSLLIENEAKLVSNRIVLFETIFSLLIENEAQPISNSFVLFETNLPS